MDQLLTAESKLQLAITHVLSALNSTIASLEEILKILDKSKGNLNMNMNGLLVLSLMSRDEGSGLLLLGKSPLSLLPADLHSHWTGKVTI